MAKAKKQKPSDELSNDTWEEITVPAPPLSQILERFGGVLEVEDEGGRYVAAARGLSPDAETSADARSVYLGNRRYADRQGSVQVLSESEDHVLRSLMLLDHSCGTKDELIHQSAKSDAPHVLRAIRKKYPGLAADVIVPGGRDKGGYRTTIRDGSE